MIQQQQRFSLPFSKVLLLLLVSWSSISSRKEKKRERERREREKKKNMRIVVGVVVLGSHGKIHSRKPKECGQRAKLVNCILRSKLIVCQDDVIRFVCLGRGEKRREELF